MIFTQARKALRSRSLVRGLAIALALALSTPSASAQVDRAAAKKQAAALEAAVKSGKLSFFQAVRKWNAFQKHSTEASKKQRHPKKKASKLRRAQRPAARGRRTAAARNPGIRKKMAAARKRLEQLVKAGRLSKPDAQKKLHAMAAAARKHAAAARTQSDRAGRCRHAPQRPLADKRRTDECPVAQTVPHLDLGGAAKGS